MLVTQCWDGIRKLCMACGRMHVNFAIKISLNLYVWHSFFFTRIVASWLKRRNNVDNANDKLLLLFDRYLPPILEANEKFLKITHTSDITLVQMTCNLLDCLLTDDNLPANCPSEWYEIYFMFAVIWGFGSALYADQQIDWRTEFSKFWLFEFRSIPFPENAIVFDFYVDKKTKQFKRWSELVPKFELDLDVPLQVTSADFTVFPSNSHLILAY